MSKREVMAFSAIHLDMVLVLLGKNNCPRRVTKLALKDYIRKYKESRDPIAHWGFGYLTIVMYIISVWELNNFENVLTVNIVQPGLNKCHIKWAKQKTTFV